jgi:hypothetical protein
MVGDRFERRVRRARASDREREMDFMVAVSGREEMDGDDAEALR